MGWFFGNNDEKEDDNDYNSRSHQDYNDLNESYQYCRHCGRYTAFEYDRCTTCHNN